MPKNNINVLMASAEIAPFAKVGGLADVVGSLPPALEKQGCQVKLIMPKYGSVDEKKHGLKKFSERIKVVSGGKTHYVKLWKARLPGTKVEVYFLEHQGMFGRDKVYFGNNSERFLFFSLAVLDCLPYLEWEPDIIHCHDYHTAMIPDLIKANPDLWGDIKTLYTIHNLNFQGKSEPEVLSTGNLSKNSLTSLSRDAQDGDVNFMVQGVLNADRVNTVSPTYAREITTSVFGAGVEKVIRANRDKISGVVNGLNQKLWNPKTDSALKQNYGSTSLHKKIKNKLFLQKKSGLIPDKKEPVVGVISRLSWQKGIDFITEDIVADSDCQFVFLGTGGKKYEKHLRDLEQKYPDKVSANIEFDGRFARQIYAGADIFLMPSRFEPCGLGQMIAMRYGTVPVVRDTGGLKDTVTAKTGFKFNQADPEALKQALTKALKVYRTKPEKWREMQKEGMGKDFSWEKSAGKYYKLYQEILDI